MFNCLQNEKKNLVSDIDDSLSKFMWIFSNNSLSIKIDFPEIVYEENTRSAVLVFESKSFVSNSFMMSSIRGLDVIKTKSAKI